MQSLIETISLHVSLSYIILHVFRFCDREAFLGSPFIKHIDVISLSLPAGNTHQRIPGHKVAAHPGVIRCMGATLDLAKRLLLFNFLVRLRRYLVRGIMGPKSTKALLRKSNNNFGHMRHPLSYG